VKIGYYPRQTTSPAQELTMQDPDPYGADTLPEGIRSRMVDHINGLNMHILEAGFEDGGEGGGRPCLLLLHGFPELAYSWRKVMVPLAAAGYHVVAPDQRGYGRTTGQNSDYVGDYDGDLTPFRFLNLVRDGYCLIQALGYDQVAGVIGHDFGSPIAANCALIRPDVFRSVAMMSGPYGGPPPLTSGAGVDIHGALAGLERPRKHYHHYYCSRPANGHMTAPPQGIHDFLRAYYHHKSADWAGNEPFPLAAWTADELAQLPTYYIMDHGETMPQTVAHEMPNATEIAACAWLPDNELAVYAGEYGRNGFQGGLNWYRSRTHPSLNDDLALFAGRSIDVPSCFIAGASDWGIHQAPGTLKKMQTTACSNFRALHLLDGAGHWVQQEQPEAVVACLLAFLDEQKG
jgi:pimeloyl-ACP methyl ester carboxylesterase